MIMVDVAFVKQKKMIKGISEVKLATFFSQGVLPLIMKGAYFLSTTNNHHS